MGWRLTGDTTGRDPHRPRGAGLSDLRPFPAPFHAESRSADADLLTARLSPPRTAGAVGDAARRPGAGEPRTRGPRSAGAGAQAAGRSGPAGGALVPAAGGPRADVDAEVGGGAGPSRPRPARPDPQPLVAGPRRSPTTVPAAMSRGGGKGPSLKDKLDGNELDLSLCDLNEVPVRELVSVRPAGRPPGPGPQPRGRLCQLGPSEGGCAGEPDVLEVFVTRPAGVQNGGGEGV